MRKFYSVSFADDMVNAWLWLRLTQAWLLRQVTAGNLSGGSRGINVHCYYHVTLYIVRYVDISYPPKRLWNLPYGFKPKSSGYSTRKSPFMSDAWRIDRACRSNTLYTKLLIASLHPAHAFLSWRRCSKSGVAAVLLAIQTLGMLITSLHPWSSA